MLKSFNNELLITTYDSTINYTYQFTKTSAIEINYKNKISRQYECFLIENEKDTHKYLKLNNIHFFIYNKGEWLVVFINGIPQIGNSTYYNNRYIYFKNTSK